MEQIYAIATLWLVLAIVSAIIAYHLRISIALVEICVGVATAAAAAAFGKGEMLGANLEWLRFLASSGAVLLTFLAGAELDPTVLRTKIKEVTVVGLISFLAPFLGCTAIAYYGIGWNLQASWLCGVALSTTSMAVVYSVMLVLFGLGALALWSGSEAVLPAYIAGMVLAGSATRDTFWVRRLRTLTVGFLTPFYFLRAGTLVSLSALIATPLVFVVLLAGKVVSKIFGLYPVIGLFRSERNERWYYTLLMSTGLTFGTISALYGLSHGIVTQEQYSFLVATVIASAVVPTLIAEMAFLPKHLLPPKEIRLKAVPHENGASEEG
ncbi:MAG: hypothetical protein D4R56_05565 [Deltaproteobacteria bacterium]|nr:MAG: hypothetical protein D4R56_05565 [Deltaproteobacteria bacterium]